MKTLYTTLIQGPINEESVSLQLEGFMFELVIFD
mgnify:CR=1 FL=1